MNDKEYPEQRVEDQIAWYDRKSRLNKRWYISLSLVEITLAALIPLCSSMDRLDALNLELKRSVGVTGAAIAIAAAAGTLQR